MAAFLGLVLSPVLLQPISDAVVKGLQDLFE